MMWLGTRSLEEIEPEEGDLGEDVAFAGDAGGEDVIKGGDAVSGDEEEVIADGIEVADFTAAEEGRGAKICGEKSCHEDGPCRRTESPIVGAGGAVCQ